MQKPPKSRRVKRPWADLISRNSICRLRASLADAVSEETVASAVQEAVWDQIFRIGLSARQSHSRLSTGSQFTPGKTLKYTMSGVLRRVISRRCKTSLRSLQKREQF